VEDRLHCLTNEAWKCISEEFPHAIGIKGVAHTIPSRDVFEAVLCRARTGCPWRDLPNVYGPWHTIYMRWQRWVTDGVLTRVWKIFQQNQIAADSVIERFKLYHS